MNIKKNFQTLSDGILSAQRCMRTKFFFIFNVLMIEQFKKNDNVQPVNFLME